MATERASAYACINPTCPEQLRGLSDMPGFCSVCHHDLAPMEAGEDVSLYAAKVRGLEARVATLTRELPCPDSPECRTCKCADEDDACFPDEAVRALRARAEAAEREAATLREALEAVLAHPRWLSIGSENNTAELHVGRAAYDRARAALAGAGRSTEGEG